MLTKLGMVLLTVKIHLGITANVVPEYFIVLLCVAMPRCHPVMQYWYCILQCPDTSTVLGSNTRSEHS